MQWISVAISTHAELALLFAIPNGGWRHEAVGAAMKRQGVQPGVPDFFLPVARGTFHGLFLEMKRRQGGQLSQAQKSWLVALQEQGYRTVVAKGWEDARACLLEYLTT